MNTPPSLTSLVDALPEKTGCYLFKDAAGDIIYVGKAINLRQRVRSYFQGTPDSPKTRELVRHIADLEYLIVGSELEALILEMTLIKRHRPRYNVRLKDDRHYPYIKVHYADDFPKVTITRRRGEHDGQRYFGPFTSTWAVQQALETLRKIFPYLTCDRLITGTDSRACLYKDIRLCLAPCVGACSAAEYRAMIDDLCCFLAGHTAPVVARLQEAMQQAAVELQFEKAAALRDQLVALERIVEKQRIISPEANDADIIAFAQAESEACVQVFFIRSGKLIGRDYFVLEGVANESAAHIISSFVTQFYDRATYIPPEVLLPEAIEEARIINEWLNSKRGGDKVILRVPASGIHKELLEMATTNAIETLNTLRAQWAANTKKQLAALEDLQAALNLPHRPHRIEGYDVSHLQGTVVVASMVVFEEGLPRQAHYRRFIIKSVTSPDDYAALREALQRRLRRWQETQAPSETPPAVKSRDESFAHLPDVMLIDGGPGQLHVAQSVLATFALHQPIALCSLAKQREEIFVPSHSQPLPWPSDSPGSFLLQRVRDEAHRFALEHQRHRRTRLGLASQLEAIPGIGPARRRALWERFGSLTRIQQATVEELAATPGMTRAAALAVKEYLADQ